MINSKKLIILFFILSYCSFSQTGISKPPTEKELDSNFIFVSPRPLIKEDNNFMSYSKSYGVDLVFSNSGFGGGMNFQYFLNKDWSLFGDFFLSGARNTDELEYYDPITFETFIPNKVNRLFQIPLTFGFERKVLRNIINENIEPYFDLGIGTSFIFATPYRYEFFQSFKYIDTYIRFASYIGIGSNFGAEGKRTISFGIRYYYIPFSEKGIESIMNSPIKDFGGIFLTLKVATKY